jgi:hypothetical protein
VKNIIISYLKTFYSNFMSFKALPIKELDKTIWAEETYDKLTEKEKEKILSNYNKFKSN